MKLSIVVQPLSPIPGLPKSGISRVVKYLEKADSSVSIAKLWRTIEDRYRRDYLEQAYRATFAIKKIQDEDGNDIDITFTLSDIFEDLPAGKPGVLNVIPTRIDRDVSIPVTSNLRPKDAPRRPPVPLFNAQPFLQVNEYANLDPDRPVGSTERELADGENGREDQEAADDDDDENEVEDDGAHDQDLPQDRSARTRKDVIDETSDDEQQESHSGPGKAHEVDEERRQLPRNNIVEAADRAHAAILNNVPQVAAFAKPTIPAPRAGPTQRFAHLLDAAGPSQHNSRSVRNALLSRPSSKNTSAAPKYDSRDPYASHDSGLHVGAAQRAVSKNLQSQPYQDNVFRSGGSSRTSTDSIMSSHPNAILTPPTSNDGVNVNGHGQLRTQQTRQHPSPTSGVLSRVQSRPTHPSQSTGLSVPSNAQGTKLRSPFQPQLAVNAAPSSSFDDAGESPIPGPNSDLHPQRLDLQGLHHRATPPIAHSDLNEAADDVEDSMHEDVVRRTAPRRKEAGLKRHSRERAPALELANRNGTSPSPPLSRSQSVAPRGTTTLKNNKFVTPIANSRQDRSATVPPPRNAPMVPPARNGIRSTPAQPVQHTPTATAGRSRSVMSQSNHNDVGGQVSQRPIVTVTPALATQAEASNANRDKESPEWPRDYSVNSEVEALQNLSSQAVRDVENERALESTAADDQDAMDITPHNDAEQQFGLVKRLVSSAEARLNAQVRKHRDRQTLSWLNAQQEERNNAASVNMSQGREAARQHHESEDTELRRKKPDPKGKRRAVPTLEDRELLKSAGEPVSDERMDIDNDGEQAGVAGQNDFNSSPSSTRRSVYEERHIPFAVVIDVPPKDPSTSNAYTSPAQSSRLVESTPSQEIPTSAQPIQRTSATIPASAPSTQGKSRFTACADCRGKHQRCGHGENSQPTAIVQQLSSPLPTQKAAKVSTTDSENVRGNGSTKTPSQEYFAFLPEKPGPDPPKRKRKNPASSPPENLASELRKLSPEQKKRKLDKSVDTSNVKNVKCCVALPGGELCQRSLTCHVHGIAQRRAVPGRDAPLDQLLARLKDQAKPNSRKSAFGSSLNEPIVVPSDAEIEHVQRKKQSPNRRRASTAAPEPIELNSDGDVLPKQRLSPSRGRRAATAAPPSPRRRSITSRLSLVAGQDPIVVEPSDVETETRQIQSPSRTRRAASVTASQPRRRSSQASSQRDVVMLDGAADSPSASSNSTPSRHDASHSPTHVDNMDIDVEDQDMQAGSALPSQSQAENSVSPSLSFIHQLDAELQSSANSRHSQEQHGKYNVLAKKPLLAPPMSFPTQSSQPSQPSQTSTTRSPESSPERQSEQATPVPPYKQRSSSPDWVTPQWVRDKEEREERRRLEAASQTLAFLTPSRMPRPSLSEDTRSQPKAKDSMPPPPLPAPKVPQTPLKSILKRNSTSSTSASQPVRRVSIDPAVEEFSTNFQSASQPTSKTSRNDVPTMSTIMAGPDRSPSKINEYSALEASPLMSDHTIKDRKARVAALQLDADNAIVEEDEDTSDDGDVEDNEVGSGSDDDEDDSALDADDMARIHQEVGSGDELDSEDEAYYAWAKTHAPSGSQPVDDVAKDDSDGSMSDDEADDAVAEPFAEQTQPTAQAAQHDGTDGSDDSETESEYEKPVSQRPSTPVRKKSLAETVKTSASPVKTRTSPRKSPEKPAETISSQAKTPRSLEKTRTSPRRSSENPAETMSSQAKTKEATKPARAVREFVVPTESEFKIPLGPRPPQPIAPRYRFTGVSSQSAASNNKNDSSSDDDTSSDESECVLSHESDDPEAHEAEVSRRLASKAPGSKVKINSERNLVKWYLRQDRIDKRKQDKLDAEEKAKFERYKQMVFGNANTDPWAEERAAREAKAKMVGRRRKSDNYD